MLEVIPLLIIILSSGVRLFSVAKKNITHCMKEEGNLTVLDICLFLKDVLRFVNCF